MLSLYWVYRDIQICSMVKRRSMQGIIFFFSRFLPIHNSQFANVRSNYVEIVASDSESRSLMKPMPYAIQNSELTMHWYLNISATSVFLNSRKRFLFSSSWGRSVTALYFYFMFFPVIIFQLIFELILDLNFFFITWDFEQYIFDKFGTFLWNSVYFGCFGMFWHRV